MGRLRVLLGGWLPVGAWVVLINRLASVPYLRALALLEWLARRLGGPGHHALAWLESRITEYLLRKAGHVIVYFVLGLLLYRALQLSFGQPPALTGYLTLTLGVLVAVHDEWVQAGVPGRRGQAADVLLDVAGLSLSVLVVWGRLLGRRAQTGR
jgi:hypothetical protein